jgi:acetolactate synthase-1/3 small subunit
MEKKTLYTITISCENVRGLTQQISIIFTRRGVNMETFFFFFSEIQGVHRIIITAYSDEDSIEKIVKQIDKRVGILNVSYNN